MAYCDLDDIRTMMDEEELIQYTDDFDTGLVQTSVTDKAIAGADSLIDSHIATRYSVPVSPVPDIINGLAMDIAIYKISSRRSQAPDGIRQTYEDAMKYLEKVAAGKIVIPDASTAPSSESDDAVTITSSDRQFSRDSMEGF